MYPGSLFADFFTQPKAFDFLLKSCLLALEEDGIDKTSNAIFTDQDKGKARIIAKSSMVLAGLDFIPTIFQAMEQLGYGEASQCAIEFLCHDSAHVTPHQELAYITGPLRMLFKAERVILNYIIHCSGIATLTNMYVEALKGTKITLLDTRKTLPGLRYTDKYSVLAGGAKNHRMNLEEMLMLRDVYIDYAGSITTAVQKLRSYYPTQCPPIAIECRNSEEVYEAIEAKPQRIMLDNMSPQLLSQVLSFIPESIETEITGGITLQNIQSIVDLPIYPTYISVGSITHSAPSVDCGIYIIL